MIATHCSVKKRTVLANKAKGLRARNVCLTALSVSRTTATSPRVRGRFDEKNASKGRVVAKEHTCIVCDRAEHG